MYVCICMCIYIIKHIVIIIIIYDNDNNDTTTTTNNNDDDDDNNNTSNTYIPRQAPSVKLPPRRPRGEAGCHRGPGPGYN